MTKDTPLDVAHRALIDPNASDQDHRNYYALLVAAELFVLLEAETDDTFKPQLIEDDGQTYALAFDREDRLAAFLDSPQDYVAMSGRALVSALLDADLGLGINLGMEAATMLPPGVLTWISEQITPEVEVHEALIDDLAAPSVASEALLETLSARLPILGGLADHAILAQHGGALLLAITDTPASARTSCAGAIAEALRLANIDAELDSVFVATGDPLHVAISTVGLRFDIPKQVQTGRVMQAPGSDPDKPPILN